MNCFCLFLAMFKYVCVAVCVMDQNAYEFLKKRYGLPEFALLDNEFEISSIEQESFVLKNICKKIREKIENIVSVVEKLIQPTAECYSDFYEYKFFKNSERDALFVLFKELMHTHRSILELEIIEDEKAYAEFIKQLFLNWHEMKKSLLPVFAKLKSVWKETAEEKEKLEYLG